MQNINNELSVNYVVSNNSISSKENKMKKIVSLLCLIALSTTMTIACPYCEKATYSYSPQNEHTYSKTVVTEENIATKNGYQNTYIEETTTDNKLSTGAKVGIGVGIAALLAGIVAIAVTSDNTCHHDNFKHNSHEYHRYR